MPHLGHWMLGGYHELARRTFSKTGRGVTDCSVIPSTLTLSVLLLRVNEATGNRVAAHCVL